MAQAIGKPGRASAAGRVALGLVLALVALFLGVVLWPAPVRVAGWTFVGPFSGYSNIMVVMQAAPAPTQALFVSYVDRASVVLSDPRGGRPEITFENRRIWNCPVAVLIEP
jgi:hypothetical protein